jgi:hypothetical protein
MDIGGHPPIPLAQNIVFHLGSFSTVFWVPNFWGRFEALNDIFLTFGAQEIAKFFGLGLVEMFSSRLDLSNELLCTPNEDRMQNLHPGKLTYQLPPSGPTNLLVFHLLGLGFWIFFMLKSPLEPHCKHHILVNDHSHHISSQR